MPFGIAKHSNRSQQALQDNPQAQRGPSNNSSTTAVNQAGGEDKAFEARAIHQQPQSYSQARSDLPSYIPTNNSQGIQSRAYEESSDLPSRSQSHRQIAGYPPIQPPSPIIADPRPSIIDDEVLPDYQRAYNSAPASQQQKLQQLPLEQKKSKSARFFGGFSSKSSGRSAEQPTPALQDQPGVPPNAHNNLGGLGRRISKRHKDPPPTFQSQGLNDLGEKDLLPGWQSGQNSDSHLPSPHEDDEDDSGLDPYLIRQSDHQQLEPPHGQIHGHQQQLQPTIRLAAVDHDPSARIIGNSEQSPYSQQQIHRLQQQQQQQQAPLQLLTHQQQWLAQPNPHQSPGSPVSQQNVEYQHPVPPGQYQTHSPNQISSNIQFRNPQNPEVVSQLSHDSPTEAIEEQRPPSVQSLAQAPSSTENYATPQQTEFPPRTQSLKVQAQRPLQQNSTMPPPPREPAQNRRSTDAKQALQQEGRGSREAPPSYSQQQSFGASQGPTSGNSLPPIPGQPVQGNYRGSALQREYNQSGGDQGRNTPPLPAERELNEADKVLLTKYKKVKTLYFEKQAQVEQLQNTLANQRLSQSRTSLDDNEYATRFNRLDGAIKEIAFSIRKDWKTIPRWLMPYVNQDAQKVGTKEMTAVGRAAISRWIWDEIFMKCFHPSIEPPLSAELKRIEQNLRFSTGPSSNQEEMDALTSKVIQWKLATVEGLGYQLSSPSSVDAKMRFTQMAVANLTAHLLNYLQDPAPQGIEGNATSIIELAVGIASHLPLESRDISITYPLPNEPVQPMMKIEAPLPALENPALDLTQDADSSSSNSDPKEHDTVSGDGGKSEGAKLIKKQDSKSKSMLSSLTAQGPNIGKKSSNTSAGTNESGDGKPKDSVPRVRFAAFVGVEVRGRQYLVNPTVWTI